MYDYRKVPTSKLKQRLDILSFRDEAPLSDMRFSPATVRIPLSQHLGAPAVPVVKERERVRRYDLIARSGGKVSSNVHASIDGIVTRVTNDEIHLERA
jgi:Na+-translocating ferredoxin:NAD+ oxidoreductase RnfC subunit